jgi:hypothetical protein
MNTPQASQELHMLTAQVQQVLADQLRTNTLVQTARESQALVSALPEQYKRVLNDILDRLESGALFTEESCSFSQRDLLGSLMLWTEKAGKQLATTAS